MYLFILYPSYFVYRIVLRRKSDNLSVGAMRRATRVQIALDKSLAFNSRNSGDTYFTPNSGGEEEPVLYQAVE